MKIAIVHGAAQIISSIRASLPTQYSIVWTAVNETEAISKCDQTLPDAILIDAQIVTQRIIHRVSHVLLLNPNAKQNIAKVYNAIEQGAVDVVNPENIGDLHHKLTRLSKLARLSRRIAPSSPLVRTSSTMTPLLAIGSSTGGPKALAKILSHFPSDFAAAIIIVQHLDEHFSAGFVDWLNRQTDLLVQRAVSGDRPIPGVVLVAGTNDHLYMKPDLSLAYTVEPADYVYRPSVDVFFHSLAEHWQGQATAVLLTGMGQDGAEGLRALKQKNWFTIAQNAESCAVYGMPKAAVELNAATQVLPLEEIAAKLLTLKH
jgi:two-component system, chemotaxis family, response regulator WspF